MQKYVKAKEYKKNYNIWLSILKQQVTSNFAAAKAPRYVSVLDYSWLFIV